MACQGRYLMAIEQLPIINSYDKARFTQFSPADVANWYQVDSPTGKKKKAMYPTMGRQHLRVNGRNALQFDQTPRKIFKSINFTYLLVGSQWLRVNSLLTAVPVNNSGVFTQTAGPVDFDYLPTVTIPAGCGAPQIQNVFIGIVDGNNTFIINETTNTMSLVTDPNRPPSPLHIKAFGNRFVVSSNNSTQFQLTQINLGGTLDPNAVFTIAGAAVFAQESGLIRQMGVLQNQLYIFTDYTTGIWTNTPGIFENATFPWRKNTSFEFDYGIADPDSLDVDFSMMTWLSQNKNGLVTFVMSNGQSPKPIATQAVNVLLQKIANSDTLEPLLNTNVEGFLYQYEDTIFYRASIGPYIDYQTVDDASDSVSIEFNFNTKTWHRCIELNGQRNRIDQHIFFNNKHLVTVIGQTDVYEMNGDIYFNELRNPLEPDPQSSLAYLAYPLRYENITPIISNEDYSEFITDYIEIDFVYGDSTYISWQNGFANTVFIIGELPDIHGDPVYMVAEDGVTYIVKEGTATPSLNESIYDDLFKPHIELYISDDGGMTFFSADVLEFSQLGVFQWRMRWYQGGPSRNRVYKLIAVSAAPIVILGGVMSRRDVGRPGT